jgi:hypothetical protein
MNGFCFYQKEIPLTDLHASQLFTSTTTIIIIKSGSINRKQHYRKGSIVRNAYQP